MDDKLKDIALGILLTGFFALFTWNTYTLNQMGNVQAKLAVKVDNLDKRDDLLQSQFGQDDVRLDRMVHRLIVLETKVGK